VKRLNEFEDSGIVEIASVCAHAVGLTKLESGFQISDGGEVNGPFPPVAISDESLLKTIENERGIVSAHYLVAARWPDYLEGLWEREKSVLSENELGERVKLYVLLVSSSTAGSAYSSNLWTEILRNEGETDEALFEALALVGAMSVFNTFTEGLQIEPDF